MTLRLRSVKFKNGGEIRLLPPERDNYARVDLGWGEVVCRAYDGKRLTVGDINYMLDAAKHINLTREGE